MNNQPAVKLRQALWEDVPNAVHLEGTRLRDVLSNHCHGPYNDQDIRFVIGLTLEGRMGASFKKDGVFFEPLARNISAAHVCIKKSDWDVPISSYREFLWTTVRSAILSCAGRLTKKGITVDEQKLVLHLSHAEVELFGSKVLSSESTDQNAFEEVLNNQDQRLIIQYRVIGQGTVHELDKRHYVENLMTVFLDNEDLGYCDGGDIGSGTMNIFCFVKPGRSAHKKVIGVLRKNDLLDGATIAETVEGEERVIWPPDFEGKFQLICR